MNVSKPMMRDYVPTSDLPPSAAPTGLSLAEIEAFDPQGGRGPEHGRRWRCPLCQAKERSLSVNTTTGAYNCKRQSCGARGLLLEHRTHSAQQGRSYRAAAKERILANFYSLGPTPTANALSATAWRDSLSALEALAETPGAKYLQGRGIPPELAQACGVRFSPAWAPRSEGTAPYRAGAAVVFPMCDRSGAQVAANGRYLSPNAKPKTRTGGTSGAGAFEAKVSTWVLSLADGSESIKQTGAFEADAVILCEGPMDALSLAACGFPALAVSGCNLPAWIPAACAFKRVLLGSDADSSGDEAARTWRQAVRPFAAEVERLRPPVGKDWNEALQELGRGALATWLAKNAVPQVLAAVPKPTAARAGFERHARERRRIFAAFPDARTQASGRWRVGALRYDHTEMLALADRDLVAIRSELELFGCDLDEVAAHIRQAATAQQDAERARIQSVFPQARMTASGLLKLDLGDGRGAQLYNRAEALLLAAQVTGQTTGGHPLEAAVSIATNDTQLLEGEI